MKKKSTSYLLIISTLTMLALNMAHPVTPALIKNLKLPSFMFGIFFASMSIGNFIGSPIFGALSDNQGRLKYMIIGLLGYGICQIGFGFSTNPAIIVIFRFIGGTLVTSYLTVAMAYLTDITDKNNRLKYIAYYSASTTIGTSLGSLLGGIIGNNNYKYTFLVQFILCIIISLLIYLILEESISKKSESLKINFNFISIQKFKISLNGQLKIVIFMISIFFFASTSYNSTINFYIESVLNLPPTFNGLFMSITGLLGFLTNLILTPYLGKRFSDFNIFKSITLLCGLALVLGVMIPNLLFFFIFMILFVSLASIHVPLQQSIVTRLSKNNYGSSMGLLNSSKAVGMICGSLLSGFIFDYGNKLPFIIAGAFLILGFFILLKSELSFDSTGINIDNKKII